MSGSRVWRRFTATARQLRVHLTIEPWLLRLLVVFGLSTVAINAIRPMTTYRASHRDAIPGAILRTPEGGPGAVT